MERPPADAAPPAAAAPSLPAAPCSCAALCPCARSSSGWETVGSNSTQPKPGKNTSGHECRSASETRYCPVSTLYSPAAKPAARRLGIPRERSISTAEPAGQLVYPAREVVRQLEIRVLDPFRILDPGLAQIALQRGGQPRLHPIGIAGEERLGGGRFQHAADRPVRGHPPATGRGYDPD